MLSVLFILCFSVILLKCLASSQRMLENVLILVDWSLYAFIGHLIDYQPVCVCNDLIVNEYLVYLKVSDISVEDYITATASKHPIFMPHTAGRYQAKRFRKAQCPIVERLTNSLMMHGRNNGKKLMAVRIIKHAMEIIHLLTDLNPIQVIVDAVINRY